MRITYDVYVNVNRLHPAQPPHEPARTAAALPPRRRPAGAGRSSRRSKAAAARRALDPHGACPSRWTTSTSGCCATRSTGARAGPWSTAASPATKPRPSGNRSSTAQLEGPADPARDRDPHAPRPHRPGALAVRALEGAALDQRDRLQRGARARHRRAPPASAATAAAGFFASARPDRSGGAGEDPRPRQLLRQAWCRRCRAASAACRTATIVRIGGRDWRCISGYGHAPEHIALYCDALQRADQRRHDAAAHLDQRERARRSSPRPTR